MEYTEHQAHHIILQHYLEKLVVDWMNATKKQPENCTIADLMDWSYQQTKGG